MNSPAQRPPGASGGRAQTETLGFVLVIALVLLGSALVVGLGAVAIGDTEDRLTEDRAEKALTQFDSKAALVAIGESDSHDVSFGSGAADTDSIGIEENNGWMQVTVANRTDKYAKTEVMNVTLGALVYEGSKSRLAYQGGGVWRADRNGGQMISPPEFHYRDATLTLPVIRIAGESHLNEEVTITREGTTQMFPNASHPSGELLNPLDNHVVNVTVGSEFYRGWAEYFEERTEGDVEVDDEKETVRLSLVSPVGEVTVKSALAGQKSSGNLVIQGNPHHPCNAPGSRHPSIDSYDSSQGAYCEQYDPDELNDGGELVFGGDIETASAGMEIQADLVSGGSISLHGNANYYGNFTYAVDCTVHGGSAKTCEEAQKPGYKVEGDGSVVPDQAIEFVVENTVEQFRNNADETTLPGDAPLTDGEYYTEAISLTAGEQVTFDTTGGDIVLAVNETIHLADGANITVKGEGDVEVYVNGVEGETDLHLEGSDTEIFAPNNNATRMKVLGGEDFVGKIIDEAAYTGVIYAPAGQEGDGEVLVDRQGTVYGAVVTGDMTIGEPKGGVGGTVHFDRQLVDEQVIPPDKHIIPLTFLHITTNEISVSG